MVVLPLLLALVSPLATLTEGVGRIATPGIPGVVLPLKPEAFPFIVGKSGPTLEPIAVAAPYGKGHVVAFGHDGYFGAGALTTGDTLKLVQNAIRYAGGKSDPVVGYDGISEEAIQLLGFKTVKLDAEGWKKADVVIALICPDVAKTRALLKRGGGAIAAMTPWGWQMLNPGKKLATDYNWNPILADAGVVMATGMAEEARVVASDTEATSLNVGTALANPTSSNLTLVESALWAVTDKSEVRKKARQLVKGAPVIVPTEKTPLKRKDGLSRIALILRQIDAADHQGREVDPGAADFPGLPEPGATPVTKVVSLDTKVEHWQSTGLYAAPGKTITLEVPASLVGKGLRFQIGEHTDENWNLESWTRNPSIVSSVQVNQPVVSLANPFGGLVVIAVDKPFRSSEKVTIKNAIESPYYVLGQTTDEDWARQLTSKAPWAEFQSKSLIITVPTTTARGVKDPKALMELWDHTLDVFADFDGYRPNRPERIVADRQISAGYMHSGYPIMTWMDVCDLVTNAHRLTTEGSWGHWHELGHNRQRDSWTFDGTGEVTNNMFTMLGMYQIAGKGVWDRLGPTKAKQFPAYLKAGAPFEKWKSDPFLALTMYAQIIDEFGWKSVSNVLKGYRSVDGSNWTEERKHDEWMTRVSREVGRDLGPFFQAWGVPTSESARDNLKDLKPWMPKDWPTDTK